MNNCLCELTRGLRWGHLLDGIDHQQHWRNQLHGLVEEAMPGGRIPVRVLIFDDFVHDGGTLVFALGMMRSAFPGTATRFVTEHYGQWHYNWPMLWLRRLHPEVNESFLADYPGIESQARQDIRLNLTHLVNETEDTDPESLHYRQIDKDSD